MSKHPACPSTPFVAPRPRQLRDPLLLVLGRLTAFQPSIFISMAFVLNEVIREAGFDPDNLPEAWGRDRRSRSNTGAGGGIDRNIQLAYRYGYRDYRPPLTMPGPEPGLWGLTEAGAKLSKAMSPVPLPLPRVFAEPLLRALGRLSGHTLDSLPRHEVMRATLEEAGYDPDALPKGWADPSTNSQPKIHESLRWVARSMSSFVTMPNRGFWALTPLGRERAAKLNGVSLQPLAPPSPPKVRQEPNQTSRWFSKHLTPQRGETNSELLRMMRRALIKHMPLSARHDLIEDHIQNYMVRVIRRDSFAALLATGEEIPYSKVASYCVNSSRSDIRDMGTEPVCREIMGARTNKERQAVVNSDLKVSFQDRTGGGAAYHRDTDGNIVPPDEVVHQQESTHDFEAVWKQIETVVKKYKPGAWERYVHLLMLKAQGFSTQEIAEQEGVNCHRAAKMISTVRQMLKNSRVGQEFVF